MSLKKRIKLCCAALLCGAGAACLLTGSPGARAFSTAAFNRGDNLRKLTFTNSATLTIPVLPPSC